VGSSDGCSMRNSGDCACTVSGWQGALASGMAVPLILRALRLVAACNVPFRMPVTGTLHARPPIDAGASCEEPSPISKASAGPFWDFLDLIHETGMDAAAKTVAFFARL
jgi:hypothetical protein